MTIDIKTPMSEMEFKKLMELIPKSKIPSLSISKIEMEKVQNILSDTNSTISHKEWKDSLLGAINYPHCFMHWNQQTTTEKGE